MKKTALAALAIAALSVSGCTSGTVGHATADGAAALTAAASAATARAVAVPSLMPSDRAANRQDWADEKINQYLNGRGAHNFDGFAAPPYTSVVSWSAPEPGHLVIEAEPGAWNKTDALVMAEAVMSGVGWESDELTEVTVAGTAGDTTVTVSRADVPGLN